MEEFLMKMAEISNISLDNNMLARFSIFYEMLLETNKTLNLTAITEMEDVVLKHFIDSMSISNFYDFNSNKIIDVGTGAGFPGIPLAILYPESEFVLLDSLKKRLHFIDSVLEKCEMNHVKLIHGRAEDFGGKEEYREKFDYCLSRAVASLPTLLELCTPFVKVGGKFISYKSEQFISELSKSKNALAIMKCQLEKEISYTIPNTDIYRVFAVFEKQGILAKKYPRQAGKPKKNPL